MAVDPGRLEVRHRRKRKSKTQVWFSPKQLLYLTTIENLNEPAPDYKTKAADQ
jgi:hypothetical protein